MFKQPLKLLTSVSLNNLSVLSRQNASSDSTQVATKRKWDLLSSVCLERHPVITKPKTELESRFQEMLVQIEVENSRISDYELRLEMERKEMELQKKGLLDVDLDSTVTQLAQDIEDAGIAELAAFKLSPRITEADEKNIKNSLDRKLDKSLVLLVQQNLGDKNFWLPPQGTRVEGESMRQTAERVMREICGDNLNVRIYGNAPIGFYKYAYPKALREKGIYGAKVFYYLARYVKGDLPENVKHQWLDREELREILPQPLRKNVFTFLVSE